MRFDAPEGKIELPVKLRVHDSIFVPLAKWSMLLAGNYRCVTKDGMRTAQEAVHTNIEESRSVYNFVFDLCVKLGAIAERSRAVREICRRGAKPHASGIRRARAQNGAPNIERADKLVQLIAKQKGLSHPVDRRASWRWSIRGSRPTAKRRRRPKIRLGSCRIARRYPGRMWKTSAAAVDATHFGGSSTAWRVGFVTFTQQAASFCR